MFIRFHKFYYVVLLLSLSHTSISQNTPIIVEAESGIIGNNYLALQEDDITYITISTNGTADHPENENRIATYEVSFPQAQDYDLYVRYRIGSKGSNDDSFFYGNGFGEKNVSNSGDWIRVNNIHSLGYTLGSEYVDGAGNTTTGVWKWINLSEYEGDESPIIFSVNEGDLTQIFQIGAREDGADIDKFAFARADYFFTVENLDLGTEGSPDKDSGGDGSTPLADGNDKFLGNVYSSSQAPGFTNYWNQVTPENAGKWGSAEPARDNFNWTTLDAAYNLAKDNGFLFKFHVLIWGNQQPSWIENLPAKEQLEEIEEWFQAVAERYPDIDLLEVVNEPLNDPPNSPGSGGGNYIEALGGLGDSGYDWIIEAFTLAREYFPDVDLLINEYNIVNNSNLTNRYVKIINGLKELNLIDGIGVQAHAFSTRGEVSEIISNLDKLGATGLPIYISELDIDGPSDQTQLDDYMRIFPVLWEHPSVRGITLWGWKAGMWRTSEMAYLINTDDVTERPAMGWLRGYVEGTTVSTLDNTNTIPVTIYPNPVTHRVIRFEGMDISNANVSLYNINGQMTWRGKVKHQQIQLNPAVTPGMYILHFVTDHQTFAQPILIHHKE